jgi:hypothetical protein
VWSVIKVRFVIVEPATAAGTLTAEIVLAQRENSSGEGKLDRIRPMTAGMVSPPFARPGARQAPGSLTTQVTRRNPINPRQRG